MFWTILTAVSAAVSAIAAVALAWIAVHQLGMLRRQIADSLEKERRLHTLNICRSFEDNDHLRQAMQVVWEKSDNGTNYSKLDEGDEFHVLTILNYLSGVASGIEQGILIEDLVRDYLEHSMVKSVKAFIKGESGQGWVSERSIISPDGFESLVRVQEAWSENKPAYKI